MVLSVPPNVGMKEFRKTVIFAEVPEVPRGMGRLTTVGLSTTAIFSFSRDIFSETLDMRLVLLYSDKQSIVCFSLIQKYVTLNDLDWLFRVKFCFRAGLAVSDRLRLSRV